MDKEVYNVREGSFGFLLKRVSRRIEIDLARRLKPTGLTVKNFGIIMLLLEEEGLTQNELGAKTEIAGYTTTRALDELETLDLIERRPHPASRRANQIFLTEKGRELRSVLPAMIKSVNADFLAVCSRDERKILLGALMKILAHNPLA